MLKPHFVKTLACLAPLLFSGTASAAIFDYNFGNLGVAGGSINNSVGMTVDGITVGVGAYSVANDDLGNITATTLLTSLTDDVGIYVSSSTSGNLGVVSSAGEGNNMDGGSVGVTTDPDEGLLFTFDQTVRLDYINFDSFTDASSDDFNLTVDGMKILVDFNANDSSSLVSNGTGFDEYFFNSIVGTEFLFWADGDSDSFRIDRMTVTAVPVPAAVWLFGSGLLGLFGIARRKTRV